MSDLPKNLLRTAALAAGLALGLTLPQAAQADGDDVAKIVGGLIVLGVIANALDDDDDRHVQRRFHQDPYGRAHRDDWRNDRQRGPHAGRARHDGWVWDDHRNRWVRDDFSPNH